MNSAPISKPASGVQTRLVPTHGRSQKKTLDQAHFKSPSLRTLVASSILATLRQTRVFGMPHNMSNMVD
jgi:hypothetical protein